MISNPILNLTLLALVGGLFSIVAALGIAWQFKRSEVLLDNLASFAAAVIIGFAFLDLFPEALQLSDNLQPILLTALIAFAALFVIESLTGYHGHGHDEHLKRPACENTAWFVTIGDTIHNFIDGIAIGAAFLISPALAWGTALAVAAHEIPQELSDFGVMLKCGWSVKKAAIINIISSLFSIVGAIGLYFLRDRIETSLPYLLAIAAGMFTYIAAADLIPQIHESYEKRHRWPLFSFLVGLGLIIVLSIYLR